MRLLLAAMALAAYASAQGHADYVGGTFFAFRVLFAFQQFTKSSQEVLLKDALFYGCGHQI